MWLRWGILPIKTKYFDKFYAEFISNLKLTPEDAIFELSESKFHQIRASVPRAVFEENSRQGVVKMGTDVQLQPNQFKNLLDQYRDFTKVGIGYNLFAR